MTTKAKRLRDLNLRAGDPRPARRFRRLQHAVGREPASPRPSSPAPASARPTWAGRTSGIMGFRENLEACRYLVACTRMALFGDADTGYGNAVNVFFTVRGFEDAGLAGVMIEDQVWPKRCGHMKGKEVISLEEGRKNPRRGRGATRSGLRHQVAHRHAGHAWHRRGDQRLNSYAEAGADLLFADALLSVDDIARWRRTCRSRCASTWDSASASGRRRRCYRRGRCRTSASRSLSIRGCSPRRQCRE